MHPNWSTFVTDSDSSEPSKLENKTNTNKLVVNKSSLSPNYYSKRPSKIPRKALTPPLKATSLNNIIDLLGNMIDPNQTQQQTVTLRQSCSIFSDCGRMVNTQSKTVRVNVMPHVTTSSPAIQSSTNNTKVRLKSNVNGKHLTSLTGKDGLRKGIFSTVMKADRSNGVEPNMIILKNPGRNQMKITVLNEHMQTDFTKKSNIIRPHTVTHLPKPVSRAFNYIYYITKRC